MERGEEPKRKRERGTEADEGMGEVAEGGGMEATERAGHSGEYPTSVYHGDEVETVEDRDDAEVGRKDPERSSNTGPPHGVEIEAAVPGPSCPGPPLSGRPSWQVSPWLQPSGRPLEGDEEDDDEEEEDVDFGRFADESGVAFSGQTYDEIEDGTGQVSQRPLLPASPTDDSEYLLGPPDLSWPPPNIPTQGPGGAMAPSRHLSPSSAQFPPSSSSSSPPIPSSSSSLSLAGAPYTGKVHFCHCGKAYTLKSMRDRHVKMQHLNLRPFACPVCAKRFKMKHHLAKHLKTHGGLRPFECGLCGKKVIWRDSFLRHQARCERLAAAGMPPGYDPASGSAVAGGDGAGTGGNDLDDGSGGGGGGGGYEYGFEDGEGFLSEGGQVKVEEADFQGEAEAAMGNLLGGVSVGGDGLGLGAPSRTMGSRGLKEEEGERYS
ncbi:hypothetical protein AGOR_G00044100 [Albula goreensis]|uniref:C2H2-type domain-containing protein n=1 Tax=Albula goreensis TaxID=1534307 RepID=A0A8T3DZ88_9TELE|nr:hypothetical protein AGOR_G00044100 [Albula goreensis]